MTTDASREENRRDLFVERWAGGGATHAGPARDGNCQRQQDAADAPHDVTYQSSWAASFKSRPWRIDVGVNHFEPNVVFRP